MMKMAKRFSLTSDWMYLLALMAAIFKDLIDLIEFAIITYIIIIVITICISIFIAMMMMLGGKTRMICWIILLIGTTAEMIFGVNILPIETMMVMTIYILTQSERSRAQKTA